MNQIDKIDWLKMDNLIPVITQDATTNEVLMLGYMNKEALELSKAYITTDSIQLLDSYNKDNNSFYIYKIANGKIEKETNDTIKFPINILSTTKINKTNNTYNIYLQPLSAYKLMVKEFNIEVASEFCYT